MIEQGTEEWRELRAGRITASRMSDVMQIGDGGVFKSGPRKGQPKPEPMARTQYAMELAAERLTMKPRPQINARALQWGKDVEPAARAAYEAERGVITEPGGFFLHPEYDFIGVSPDFLVLVDGGGEIKSPESPQVHLETLLYGLPDEHIEQIQGGLWVTRRKWWDFVSYHPDFPECRRLYIQRVTRDEVYIAKMEEACLSLEAEVRRIVEAVMPRSA